MNGSITPSSVNLLLPKVSSLPLNSPLVETYSGTFIRHLREPAESNTIKLLINLFTSLFSKIRSMGMNMYEHE